MGRSYDSLFNLDRVRRKSRRVIGISVLAALLIGYNLSSNNGRQFNQTQENYGSNTSIAVIFTPNFTPTPTSTSVATSSSTFTPTVDIESTMVAVATERDNVISSTATQRAGSPTETAKELALFPQYYRESTFKIGYVATGELGRMGGLSIASSNLLEVGNNKNGETIAMFISVDPEMHGRDMTYPFKLSPAFYFESLKETSNGSDFTYREFGKILSTEPILNSDGTRSGISFWIVNMPLGRSLNLKPAGIDKLAEKSEIDKTITYGGIGFPGDVENYGYFSFTENFGAEFIDPTKGYQFTTVTQLANYGMSGLNDVEVGVNEEGRMIGSMIAVEMSNSKISYLVLYPDGIKAFANEVWKTATEN